MWLYTVQPRVSTEKFPGGGGPAEKKTTKNSKKYRKIALLRLFQREGAAEKKTEKIAKKDQRKTVLFSLYLLYLYHVWKSRGGGEQGAPAPPPLPTPMSTTQVITQFSKNVTWVIFSFKLLNSCFNLNPMWDLEKGRIGGRRLIHSIYFPTFLA